jgi:FkbM family methyltransferase
MGNKQLNNFLVIDSVYGSFIVNRHSVFQAETLVKTGRTHIEKELETIFTILDRLPAGAIIIDGGSNIGFFSIPVSQRLKDRSSTVIAFEPQRFIYYAIAGAVALNDLHNCFVHNLGLGEVDGEADLPDIDYSQAFDFGTISLKKRTQSDATNRYIDDSVIRTVTIDSLKLPRLDFIKLDVEGFECNAIRGGLGSIARFRPFLWVEYFIVGQEAIKQALSGVLDYEYVLMDGQNMLCAPKEKMAAMGITAVAV